MKNRNFSLLNLLKAFNVFTLFLSLFRGDSKEKTLYRVAFMGVIGLVLGRISYIVYRLYKFGYVREIERKSSEDNMGDDDIPDLDDDMDD